MAEFFKRDLYTNIIYYKCPKSEQNRGENDHDGG